MPVCTVSGTVRDNQGQVLASTKIVFERTGVFGQDSSVVIPRSVGVTSDAAGLITVDLYPGVYLATTIGIRGPARFAVGVPDAPSANLADIIDQYPAITSSVLSDAVEARDRAEAAADRVDLGALDAAVQATADDALATGFDREQTGLDVLAAEAARDAAFVNADVYADIETGRAAVADGGQFQVVTGDQ
uniref:hypothetical protein n=1 Tax=Acidiphilium sp. TaxID=527 RepID=UPI00258AB3C9